jgi:hypothetical protein
MSTTVTVSDEVITLTQEVVETITVTVAEQGPPGVSGVDNHGLLAGLDADDHPQYHNDSRGDLRYSLLAHNHTGTYEPSGVVATHEAALDPHPGYALESSLGGAALLSVGTTAGTVAAGDDARFATGTTGDAFASSHPGGNSHIDWTADQGATDVHAGNIPDLSGTYAVTAHDHAATYAPIAQGVTNGDSHDHSGGDGAQIAYSGLSGLPTLYAGAASEIHAATAKTTPVDADELGLVDSAASWVLKKLSWGNLKTTLSSVFAVLAGKSGGQTLIGGTGVTDKLVLQGTSGNGTSTATALEVNVGNNGATSALTVLNDGKVGVKKSPTVLIDIAGVTGDSIVIDNAETVPSGQVKDSPTFLLKGKHWSSTLGPRVASGGIQLITPVVGSVWNNNISPRCKLSFLVGANNATPTEKMYISSDGQFYIAGGADFSGPSVSDSNTVYVRNTELATSGVAQPSNKLILSGQAWNSAQGPMPNQGVLQVINVTNNANPTLDRLAISVASANNPLSPVEVLSLLSNSTVGINVTYPSAALHTIKTTEQLRLGYDATNYLSATVDASGNITLDTTGGTIKTPDVIENTTAGEGIILKSPDGTRYKLTVANGGTLSIAAA